MKISFFDTDEKLSYRSSNKKIATVDSSGKIKAKKVGKCKIYVKKGGKKYTCKVVVIKHTYENIANMIIANHINKSMTDYDKVFEIHNWMCNYISYGRPSVKKYKEIKNKDHAEVVATTVKGVLITRKAICEGYAKTWQYFMKKLKVPSLYITGDDKFSPEGYAWNEVKLNGKWYYVDVTWDDWRGIADTDQYSFDNFLISTSRMRKGHVWNQKVHGRQANKDYKINGMNFNRFVPKYMDPVYDDEAEDDVSD